MCAASRVLPPKPMHIPDVHASFVPFFFGQLEAWFTPYLVEAKQLEETGMFVNLVSSMPPWFWLWTQNGQVLVNHREELSTAPAKRVKGSRDWDLRTGRERAIRNVLLYPQLVTATDGATMFNLCKLSVGEDPFTNVQKQDMDKVLRIHLLRKGSTLRQLCETLLPGCSDPQSPTHWYCQYVLAANRHSATAELQAATLEPKRVEPRPAGGGTVGSKSKRGKANKQGDGRMPEKPPEYAEVHVQEADPPYNHKGFVPGVNGDEPGALDAVVPCDVLVRVMVVPNLFERELPGVMDAIKTRVCMCLMHAGMRTMESTLKAMLKPIIEKFLASGKAQAIVNEHLNDAIKSGLKGWWRKLLSTAPKKSSELNDITLNGGEVQALIPDLALGKQGSKLIAAVRTTATKLGISHTAMHLDDWSDVLYHWAVMMECGYKMRPTAEDRDLFAQHARFYVLRKVCIADTSLCWYDWQLHSAFPTLFNAFGSLRLLCQEGMEAQQRLNNDLNRRGNNGSNAGRIPNHVINRGIEAIAEFLRDRTRHG